MTIQLAYLGLGHMGQNLVQKGNLEKPLIIYNRTAHRAISLQERIGHCIIADSVEEAISQSDIVFSCLTNDAAVNATFDAALSRDLKGKLFVDCSTTTPQTTDALAKRLAAAGAGFVAMPVFGEPSMAEAGTLVCVPAGPSELVDRVKPYCTGVIGQRVIDMGGEEQSKATILKLIGNIFIVNMIESVAGGHVMAEKTGLGHDFLQKFIQQVFPGPFAMYSKKMVTGDYYQKAEPAVPIGMARGVVSEVLSLAADCGTSLRAYEVAGEHMAMVEAHAGPTGDISGIYGAIRQESGLRFENQES